VRSAYAALRVLTSSAVKPIKTVQLHIPVARRNESCEARANEAPAKGGASRPDHATTSNRATAHTYGFIGIPNGMLRGCAPLTPRYGVIANIGHR